MSETETLIKPKPKPKCKPKTRPKRTILRQEDLSAILSVVGTAVVFSHRFLSENDLLLLPSQTISLESSIGTSATTITKLHSLFSLSNNLSIPHALTPPFSCWFHRFSSSISENDPRWFENFRMSKPTFTQLLKTMTPSLQTFETANNGGNFSIPPDYKLGAALFRLAHAASFKTVGKRFGLDSAGACRAFYEVCKALQDKLGHLIELGSDLQGIIRGFSTIGLVNCCGVLGFSRFFIESDDDKSRLEGDNSVILQCVVDSEGRFLDYSVGWSGSLKPDVILSRTRLFSRVEKAKELLNGAPVELSNGFLMPQYMLGDSCCPLLPWLITPYPDSNGSVEFNSVHKHGMGYASKAFGRIRSLWRLLSLRQKAGYAEILPHIIPAACVLNNFLIMCGEHMANVTASYSELPFPMFDWRNPIGETIRDALALHVTKIAEDGFAKVCDDGAAKVDMLSNDNPRVEDIMGEGDVEMNNRSHLLDPEIANTKGCHPSAGLNPFFEDIDPNSKENKSSEKDKDAAPYKEKKPRRKRRCKKCHQIGHDIRTCKVTKPDIQQVGPDSVSPNQETTFAGKLE